MIKYYVANHKNLSDGSVKYFAQIAPVTPVNLNDIANRISKTCTVTEHDVKAVLSALQEQLFYSLSDGHSVRLGDLGSFRPTLCSMSHATPEEVSASSVKFVRTRFTSGSRLVAALRPSSVNLTLTRVSKPVADMTTEETE